MSVLTNVKKIARSFLSGFFCEFFPRIFRPCVSRVSLGLRKRGRRVCVASDFFRFLPFSSVFCVFLFSVSILFPFFVFFRVRFWSFFPRFLSIFFRFIFRKKTGRHRSQDPFCETPIAGYNSRPKLLASLSNFRALNQTFVHTHFSLPAGEINIRGCQASQRKGLTCGEVRGSSRKVWETSGEPLDCSSFP